MIQAPPQQRNSDSQSYWCNPAAICSSYYWTLRQPLTIILQDRLESYFSISGQLSAWFRSYLTIQWWHATGISSRPYPLLNICFLQETLSRNITPIFTVLLKIPSFTINLNHRFSRPEVLKVVSKCNLNKTTLLKTT